MHSFGATVRWTRQGEDFVGGKYSRAHEWGFDGGMTVTASASPLHVPLPYSSAEAIDPEEALVAAASSCHMLMFLYLAAKAGFTVEAYEDRAEGFLSKDSSGRLAMSRIVLQPSVSFSDVGPTDEQLADLHHRAHDECYVANSLRSEIVVDGPSRVAPC